MEGLEPGLYQRPWSCLHGIPESMQLCIQNHGHLPDSYPIFQQTTATLMVFPLAMRSRHMASWHSWRAALLATAWYEHNCSSSSGGSLNSGWGGSAIWWGSCVFQDENSMTPLLTWLWTYVLSSLDSQAHSSSGWSCWTHENCTELSHWTECTLLREK